MKTLLNKCEKYLQYRLYSELYKHSEHGYEIVLFGWNEKGKSAIISLKGTTREVAKYFADEVKDALSHPLTKLKMTALGWYISSVLYLTENRPDFRIVMKQQIEKVIPLG